MTSFDDTTVMPGLTYCEDYNAAGTSGPVADDLRVPYDTLTPGLVKVPAALPWYSSTQTISFRGRVVYTSYASKEGWSLFISDGTNVRKLLTGSNGPLENVVYKGWLYFSYGSGLWKTDGSAVNTTRVPFIGASPQDMTVVGDKLFFRASEELVCTNGTAEGTVYFDLRNDSTGLSSIPDGLTAVGNTPLFFFANDGIHGNELWKSDGTIAGTMMVKGHHSGPREFGRAG